MSIIPKYRFLSREELSRLEPQFVQYLASEGISADLWQRYQQTQDSQIDYHLVRFSDQVLQNVYQACDLVELVHRAAWIFYTFDQYKVYLKGFMLETSPDFDLRLLSAQELKTWFNETPEGVLKLISAEKQIVFDKEQEVHQLILQGGFISENTEMFRQILTLFQTNPS